MAKVIKVYKESFPPLRFIGKRYLDSDRGPDGGFANVWDQWFEHGDFKVLEELRRSTPGRGPGGAVTEDELSHVAYMGFVDGVFEYWVGMLFPAGTEVPEGYAFVDVHAGDVGICWIHGRDDTGELYGPKAFEMCLAEIEKAGWQMADDGWCYERYHPSRFRTEDADGNVILDFGIELKGRKTELTLDGGLNGRI